MQRCVHVEVQNDRRTTRMQWSDRMMFLLRAGRPAEGRWRGHSASCRSSRPCTREWAPSLHAEKKDHHAAVYGLIETDCMSMDVARSCSNTTRRCYTGAARTSAPDGMPLQQVRNPAGDCAGPVVILQAVTSQLVSALLSGRHGIAKLRTRLVRSREREQAGCKDDTTCE